MPPAGQCVDNMPPTSTMPPSATATLQSTRGMSTIASTLYERPPQHADMTDGQAPSTEQPATPMQVTEEPAATTRKEDTSSRDSSVERPMEKTARPVPRTSAAVESRRHLRMDVPEVNATPNVEGPPPASRRSLSAPAATLSGQLAAAAQDVPGQQERRSVSTVSHYAVAASNDDTSEPRQRVPPRPDPQSRLICRGLLSLTPRGQPPQPAEEMAKSTVLLSCGHFPHRGCWARYRHREYDDFVDWAKLQPTDQIWKEYTNGRYFKMLRCPTCTTPVHETLYDTAHSGISEHIGWAIHDHHEHPSTHFYLGDLGSSTNKMSELAKAILTD